MRTRRHDASDRTYALVVNWLASAGRWLRVRPCEAPAGLSKDLAVAGLRLDASMIRTAARTAALLAIVPSTAIAMTLWAMTGYRLLYLVPPLAFVVGAAAHVLIITHPSRASERLVREVLKGSTAGTNLMMMSLRQEQSLSSAMLFASRRKDAFGGELRRCIWEVVMAKHAGFEEALSRFGERLARRCGEFKTAMDALVTASCESTSEGQRRALDRANSAMVEGAKRRIEVYALSLSTPSMIMFGVGILLPLMVGSFLPMLSWDLWSADNGFGETGVPSQLMVTPETVLVMNLLFPSVALMVALSTRSGHPLPASEMFSGRAPGLAGMACVTTVCLTGVMLSVAFADGVIRALCILWSVVGPAGLWLTAKGPRGDLGSPSGPAIETALFRTGARMAEGKNFQRAFAESAAELDGRPGALLRSVCLKGLVSGGRHDAWNAFRITGQDSSNSLEAVEVVRQAATKDELAAGVLAMDLAGYLRDLSELEAALRLRLRPVASMMRVTAYALAPVVLGVTFAIYMSLASITGPGADPGDSGGFLLVLGLFLAEMNAVVMYFVWSIEGGKDTAALIGSVGQCVLCSELVYSATAVMVAG